MLLESDGLMARVGWVGTEHGTGGIELDQCRAGVAWKWGQYVHPKAYVSTLTLHLSQKSPSLRLRVVEERFY